MHPQSPLENKYLTNKNDSIFFPPLLRHQHLAGGKKPVEHHAAVWVPDNEVWQSFLSKKIHQIQSLFLVFNNCFFMYLSFSIGKCLHALQTNSIYDACSKGKQFDFFIWSHNTSLFYQVESCFFYEFWNLCVLFYSVLLSIIAETVEPSYVVHAHRKNSYCRNRVQNHYVFAQTASIHSANLKMNR